ncbi:hypothetical protein QWZ13_03740 [Reinekea marina]|nr:hypothetical protein [Reinekea marina]MDN3648014.1 hypothetical protein [Reinekea marina]
MAGSLIGYRPFPVLQGYNIYTAGVFLVVWNKVRDFALGASR